MHLCPHCFSLRIKKKNFYLIKHSRSKIRRYFCQSCSKYFSSRTFCSTYRQKKPYLNSPLNLLLVSGNTERRSAKLLKCSKNTVAKKRIWLALNLKDSSIKESDFNHIQIDELETIEHTKLKPVTIPICVSRTYKVLGVSVGKIRAKGHLASISIKKYGLREDEREKALKELFEQIKNVKPITITTDANPAYEKYVKAYFPQAAHIRIIARDHLKKKRELVYTLERKRVFDPLFALNQRCAMLRADIRRLTRRSWCTTKKIENLKQHLEIYKAYNNNYIESQTTG